MFKEFTFKAIALEDIQLDKRNPRIVTIEPLKSQDAIIEYMFAHEGLADFIAKIFLERKNEGAERPYVVKQDGHYVVIEGNTRIAAYKLLCGLLSPPPQYAARVPAIDAAFRASLMTVDCSVAPSREAMLPIMANAHFGLGDKSRWGYLGSRKAVYDEYLLGKTVPVLAGIFKRPKGKIRDLIIEYMLYLEALKLIWPPKEEEKLLDPGIEFNPPVRFLQSEGHKNSVGIAIDREGLAISFSSPLSRKRFQHLVKKLVIEKPKGMGATATFDAVFKDFVPDDYPGDGTPSTEETPSGDPEDGTGYGDGAGDKGEGPGGPKLKPGALFNYQVKKDSLTLKQLMKEASEINAKRLPASATALLRSLMECILKIIIDENEKNKEGKQISLESAIDMALNGQLQLGVDDRKVLKEFKKGHLDYVNLGVHANLKPSASRILEARDNIDQFVRRNV